MNRRGILSTLGAGLAALTPAALAAKPKRKRNRKRYVRPDGARCWNSGLVEVSFTQIGDTLVGLVFVKRSGATVAVTNQGDDILFAGTNVCIRKRG